MSNHTQGEWTVATLEVKTPSPAGELYLGVAYGDRGVCRVSRLSMLDDEDRANAYLIAASPELLSSLVEAYTLLSELGIPDKKYGVVTRAAAAIAKATEGK